MVKSLKAARKAAKQAHENVYYDGVCTIVEYSNVTDPNTKRTTQKEITVVENQPCNLSFEKISTVIQTDTAATVTQGTKLFLSPEITVKSGSKIIVEQNGIKTEYAASGEPAIYSEHQEIMLELFKVWA